MRGGAWGDGLPQSSSPGGEPTIRAFSFHNFVGSAGQSNAL